MAKRAKSPVPAGPQLGLPAGVSQDIPIISLLLDPGNLRLFERLDTVLQATPASIIGQKSLQNKLTDIIKGEPSYAIEALVASIAYNGFLRHERLIVAPNDASTYLVLEGNRRLTAVRVIYEKYGPQLLGLSSEVRNSLQTLPCYALEGPPIDGSDKLLADYRRAAEVYVGMRHLMSIRPWEPASRYEFQSRLIAEGWTIADIAQRFGRKKSDVLRDLKAQTLYHDFLKWEHRRKTRHLLTYNAFAEAARAPAIMRWLGWSEAKLAVHHRKNEEAFFAFLTSRLNRETLQDPDDETEREQSAEAVVRLFRDMLKLDDEDVTDSLANMEFERAELLYCERKEGTFAKRIAGFIRGLKNATVSELEVGAKENKRLLGDLIEQAKGKLKYITSFIVESK